MNSVYFPLNFLYIQQLFLEHFLGWAGVPVGIIALLLRNFMCPGYGENGTKIRYTLRFFYWPKLKKLLQSWKILKKLCNWTLHTFYFLKLSKKEIATLTLTPGKWQNSRPQSHSIHGLLFRYRKIGCGTQVFARLKKCLSALENTR